MKFIKPKAGLRHMLLIYINIKTFLNLKKVSIKLTWPEQAFI